MVAHPSLHDAATQLALRYGFVLVNDAPNAYLQLTPTCLVLKSQHFKPMYMDLTDPRWQTRAQQVKQQGLLKACLLRPGVRMIDATAGWGRDAAILFYAGAEVLMLERHPVMAALLEDAVQRLSTMKDITRIKILHTDAQVYLQALSEQDYPDVIYIDPMHPIRQKSALVKKDMQILQSMVLPDADASNLITLARQRTRERVVVKWPNQSTALLPTPNYIGGKTVRFDIYVPSTTRK